jgi:cell division protein FtsB
MSKNELNTLHSKKQKLEDEINKTEEKKQAIEKYFRLLQGDYEQWI